MPTITVQKIIDKVKSKCNMERSNFVTTTEYIDWINDARRELYSLMVDGEVDESFNLADATLTITDGEASLPDDFLALRKVFRNGSDGVLYDFVPISLAEWREGDSYFTTVYDSGYYTLFNNKILFRPKNIAPEVKIWYNPTPPEITAAGDVIDLLFNEDLWIVYYVCIEVARKEETATGAYEKALERAERAVFNALKPRQIGTGKKVSRVRGRRSRYNTWRH